ncbi:hypothetical protein [Chryseobacterium flavum]|uniref:hypothetical protein n=1 Tax=Chryseobacterium flavum TaxID=415851 RepID=UPI0028AB51EE|nr:hypothetical protein [Chryseobacterium flavum]
MEKIKLISRLKNREMSAHEFIDYCKNIIINIKNKFNDLHMVSTWDDSTDSKFYFQNDLMDFNGQNLDKILIYNKEEDVFSNQDGQDKDLHENSKSWVGFNTLVYISREKSEVSDISVNITQGAAEKNKTALINMEFSDEFLNDITKESLIKIIKSIELSGDLIYAVIISNEFRRKVKTAGQNLWVGFLTYFENRNEARALPDTIRIHDSENGIIIDLDDNMETSDQNISKAVKIREILGPEMLNYIP